ncbi:hypothetical protein NQZ68_037197, partial [Dissostichus eleginoides]
PPFGQGDMDRTAGDNKSPVLSKPPPPLPPASCLLPLPSHDPCIAFELPDTEAFLSFQLFTQQCDEYRIIYNFPQPFVYGEPPSHICSDPISEADCGGLQRAISTPPPRCLLSCSLDVRLTWLAVTGLFTPSSANKI